MKILFLSTHLRCGGITSYLMSLVQGLSARGHEITVATGGGEFEPSLRSCARCLRIPVWTKSVLHPVLMLAVRDTVRIVRESGTDLIHAHTRVTQTVGAIASRLTGIPLVTTCHGFFKPKWSRRMWGAWGDETIAISGPVRAHLMNDLGVSASRITVVHNGVDTARFTRRLKDEEKGRLRERYGLRAPLIIAAIGRLSDVKGHRYLLEAGSRLKQLCGDRVQIVLVGDGREREHLQALVSRLGLQGAVVMITDPVETDTFLELVDIYVMPSLMEGLGIGLLEAMSMGIACVASSVGGIPDIITAQENGVLVPPRESEPLARVLADLADDPQRRSRLGAAARATVLGRFSLDRMVAGTETVYARLIAADDGSGRPGAGRRV